MSVYSRGDGVGRDDDKGKKKQGVGDEVANAFEQVGKDLSKGFSNLFGGAQKKWEKKGEGHTLGTAADADAARQARLAALEKSAPQQARQPSRQVPVASTPAMLAAEARMAGKKPPSASPRVPPPPPAAPSGQQSFPGPGYVAANPQTTYAQEIRTLVDMGFDQSAATRALAASRGDLQQALDTLASGVDAGGSSSASAPAQPASATPEPRSGPTAEVLAAAAAMSAADVPELADKLAGMRGGGTALALIRKLVGNVQVHPAEGKYRTIRLTNQKIADPLGGSREAYGLLAACGFTIDAEGAQAVMSDATAADSATLEVRCALLDEAIVLAQAGGPPVPVGPMDIKVLVAPEGRPMQFEHVSDDFYQITPAEAKALMDMNAVKKAEDEKFKTRETREAEAVRRKRVYRKSMIRVRFPDGMVLQATFSAAATVGVVLSWVEGSLREAGHAFELSLARCPPLSELGETLEAAGLAPAAMLNFRCQAAEQMSPPYLQEALMAHVQLMGEEAIPQGTSLEEQRSFQEAQASARRSTALRDGDGDGVKKPKWLQQ